MNRYLILAALLVASVSCSKEGTQPLDPTTDPNTGTTVTLTASLADAVSDTRVSANTDNDDEWTFSWDDKDAIAAWHTGCTSATEFTTKVHDPKSSTFEGELLSDENHRFIYPYEEDAAITSEGYYTIDVSSQTADKELSKTYLINDTQIETADIKDGTVSSLSMKHLGAIMVVDVYLENPIADKIYKLKGVKYSSKENAINASAEIDMTKSLDEEWLYNMVNPGTITANMDVTFTTAADDPDYLQAITRLNILPSTIRVDQSATVELTIEVYNKVNEELLETLTPSITLTNTSENNLPFDRATYNFTYLTVDGAFGAEITGATINGWGEIESGDLPTTQIKEYKASEIDEDNIPKEDTWVITDAGTITQGQMSGVCAALEAAHNDGRSIAIELPNATLIDAGVFRCNGLATIELPNVTQIGDNAFEESSIKEVTFGSIEQISQHAFYKAHLTGDENGMLTIPYTVKELGNGVFMCPFDDKTVYNSFKKVIINAPLTTIKQATFQACWNLEEVHLPETVEFIEAFAFYGCGQLSESKTLTVYITSPEVVQIDADVNMNIFKGLAATSNAAHKNDVSVTVKVDKDLVDAYNADANWAALMADKTNTYSLQIIANE